MSGTNARPQPRRGPSGAWSRLRNAPVDALSAYGLPSKGETRLSDFKTQETYFETIVGRYMKFCAGCGSGEKLEEAFANMQIDGQGANSSAVLPLLPHGTRIVSDMGPPPLPGITRPSARPTTSNLPSSTHSVPTTTTTTVQPPTNELPTLLLAMRKLREAITASHRRDAFAQRAYIFITRTTIHPFAHPESYHPSLLYLLNHIHPTTPLTNSELQEFSSYLILDLACRQGDIHEAQKIKCRHRVRDWKVERVLRALVTDNWVQFWKVRRQVDGAMRVLLGWKEDEMRRHALACLGRAYLSADLGFVERATDREWGVLVALDRVGWELEGNNVTIRRVKAKS